MSTPLDLQALSDRLHHLERKNRRLKYAFLALCLFMTGSLGYHLYDQVVPMQQALSVENVSFWQNAGTPFTFSEKTQLLTGQPVSLPTRHWRGGIGLDHHGQNASVFFRSPDQDWARLGTGEHGPSLGLYSDTDQVFLGTGLYDGKTMLELRTSDGSSAIQLGLDANDEPFLYVIRNGKVESLLDHPKAPHTTAHAYRPPAKASPAPASEPIARVMP